MKHKHLLTFGFRESHKIILDGTVSEWIREAVIERNKEAERLKKHDEELMNTYTKLRKANHIAYFSGMGFKETKEIVLAGFNYITKQNWILHDDT